MKSQQIYYELSFPSPHTHYVHVKMNLTNIANDGSIEIRMPVWAPGSYMVREFSKNVDTVSATSNNKKLPIKKSRKNAWNIETQGEKNITIEYDVYCFELTVRTSFIDADYAFLSGTSIFMYVENLKTNPISLKVIPHSSWKKINCGLDKEADEWNLKAENYDILVDAPILIGNQRTYNFTAKNIPHTIAMQGYANIPPTFETDVKKVVETNNEIIGENPCKNYTIIVINTPDGRGGLEHLNSTALMWNNFGYKNASQYKEFLSLVAHEYFHLWNVKRIRPEALGPFDYVNENYTDLLWFSEGFTQYYDDYTILRAGYYTKEEYLQIIADNITSYENSAGKEIQPVSESSFDAWIKYYRRNENSNNTQISYYTKGAFIALLLDMKIMKNSNGKFTLDDVMRELWKLYKSNPEKGFNESTIKSIFEQYTNEDLTSFFKHYIHGTEPLDFENAFLTVGLKFEKKKNNALKLGAKIITTI